MFNKKGIGPIIAISLLLVVSVVAVMSFQGWWGSYSSDLFSKVETRSEDSVSNTKIETILGTTLYFKNGFTSNLSITDIKVDGNSCSVTTNISNGMTEITLGNNCTQNLTTHTPEVVVYGAYVYYHNATISQSLESNQTQQTQSTPFVRYPHELNYSLRFGGSSSYLEKTFSQNGDMISNGKVTISLWTKVGKLGTERTLIGAEISEELQHIMNLSLMLMTN